MSTRVFGQDGGARLQRTFELAALGVGTDAGQCEPVQGAAPDWLAPTIAAALVLVPALSVFATIGLAVSKSCGSGSAKPHTD